MSEQNYIEKEEDQERPGGSELYYKDPDGDWMSGYIEGLISYTSERSEDYGLIEFVPGEKQDDVGDNPVDSGDSTTTSKPVGNTEFQPTPHTLYTLPSMDSRAFFYYFTDDPFKSDDSKYKKLDNKLTLIGRERTGLEVVIVDRDRIVPAAWDNIIDSLDIDNYPAFVAAENKLGIRDKDIEVDFDPSETNYVVLEDGWISDEVLKNSDSVSKFLNTMYDACRQNNLRAEMKKEKVKTMLSKSAEKIEGILSISASP